MEQLEEEQLLHPDPPPATGVDDPSAPFEKEANLDTALLAGFWQRGQAAGSAAEARGLSCSNRCWQVAQQYS